jgi:hypothetical protein
MLYRVITSQIIKLKAKETRSYDAGTGVIMIPENNSKIYLHWYTDANKLRSTLTLNQPSEVYECVTIINGSDTPTSIQVIKIA